MQLIKRLSVAALAAASVMLALPGPAQASGRFFVQRFYGTYSNASCTQAGQQLLTGHIYAYECLDDWVWITGKNVHVSDLYAYSY